MYDMYDINTISPEQYLSDNYLVLDFETTKSPHHLAVDGQSALCLASWLKDGVMKSVFGDELHQGELLAAIETVDFVVAHNIKFEAGWLKRMGYPLRKLLSWDTMLAEWIFSAGINRPKGYYSLQQTSLRYGYKGKIDVVKALWDVGVETYDIPSKLLKAYCERDVMLCHEIFLRQRERMCE
jgi:hypothetical protein